MTEEWRGNRQTISWLYDLHKRHLLEMDPPYQRRSVWNQRYREDFVETILLGYPAPSIFLHEDIDADGNQSYAVVDGKQRLTTIFDFIANTFPTRDDSTAKIPPGQRGVYFKNLDEAVRKRFFAYQFTIEYVPSTDELLINEVFDRINRNVAKLSRQELRHARYSGVFARASEDMATEVSSTLPEGFPRIVESSKRQMKDVEYASQLLLLAERGPSTTGQDDLDRLYAEREEDWEEEEEVAAKFRRALAFVKQLTEISATDITATRLRNQVDFYALFGAVLATEDEDLPDPKDAAVRLVKFVELVGSEEGGSEKTEAGESEARAVEYYEAARSAANDPSQRTTRIKILRQVLTGE